MRCEPSTLQLFTRVEQRALGTEALEQGEPARVVALARESRGGLGCRQRICKGLHFKLAPIHI